MCGGAHVHGGLVFIGIHGVVGVGGGVQGTFVVVSIGATVVNVIGVTVCRMMILLGELNFEGCLRALKKGPL